MGRWGEIWCLGKDWGRGVGYNGAWRGGNWGGVDMYGVCRGDR